jgi:bifunctional DNA-binding transcriptional regulator/antitoxin component of YhaV-PrlF toxin-antitoxin module
MSQHMSLLRKEALGNPHSYTSNIGAKGRTVVPQAVRRALNVQEGDALIYLETPDGFRLTTKQALIEQLAGVLAADDGRDLTQELLDDRRAEALKDRESR